MDSEYSVLKFLGCISISRGIIDIKEKGSKFRTVSGTIENVLKLSNIQKLKCVR